MHKISKTRLMVVALSLMICLIILTYEFYQFHDEVNDQGIALNLRLSDEKSWHEAGYKGTGYKTLIEWLEKNSGYSIQSNHTLQGHLLQEDKEKANRFAGEMIWQNTLPVVAQIADVPLIQQLPELPRGCEVTALAMLLQHAGIDVDKLTLAEDIQKVPFEENGLRGSMYQGFVGDMYAFDTPGLGVYYPPIEKLAEIYLPDQIVNLTGEHFEEILLWVANGFPVWVIHNSWYSQLPMDQFEYWETPTGPLYVTYRMHSVVITGYDEDYVYFNDPLQGEPNQRVTRLSFKEGWMQMGSQAISYFVQMP